MRRRLQVWICRLVDFESCTLGKAKSSVLYLLLIDGLNSPFDDTDANVTLGSRREHEWPSERMPLLVYLSHAATVVLGI